jgi:hypothetical protein
MAALCIENAIPENSIPVPRPTTRLIPTHAGVEVLTSRRRRRPVPRVVRIRPPTMLHLNFRDLATRIPTMRDEGATVSDSGKTARPD